MLLEAILAEQPFYPKTQSMETGETLNRQVCEADEKKLEETTTVNEQMVRLNEKPNNNGNSGYDNKAQTEKTSLKLGNEMYTYQQQQNEQIQKQIPHQQQNPNFQVQEQQNHVSQKNLQHQQVKTQKPQKPRQDTERAKQQPQQQQQQQIPKQSAQINQRASPVITNQFPKDYPLSTSNKPMNLTKLEDDKSQMVNLYSFFNRS